jgi:hypothetical protein
MRPSQGLYLYKEHQTQNIHSLSLSLCVVLVHYHNARNARRDSVVVAVIQKYCNGTVTKLNKSNGLNN